MKSLKVEKGGELNKTKNLSFEVGGKLENQGKINFGIKVDGDVNNNGEVEGLVLKGDDVMARSILNRGAIKFLGIEGHVKIKDSFKVNSISGTNGTLEFTENHLTLESDY